VTRAPEASAAWRTRASSTLRGSERLSASTIGFEYWRAAELSVSSFWSRTPASRPEVTPRYTPAITTSVMAKNSSARRLVSDLSC
jgi:hypothetical protein